MAVGSERVLSIPEDIGHALDVGVNNLPDGTRVVFGQESIARDVGTNVAALADVHALGLRHAASPIISDAARRRGAEDTWRRYRDSSFLIARITTSDNAARAAEVIHDIHVPIVGTDENGIETSALDPLHFANAAVRNWQHADNTANRMGLSEADRDQLALEERVKFQLIGVDDTHLPLGRAALADRARALESSEHVFETPLVQQLLERTEPPAKLGELMDAVPDPLESILDRVVAGPLHARLTDAALTTMPAETREAMGVDVRDWTIRRRLVAHTTRLALEELCTHLGTHESPYLRTHPDLVVSMYGEPETNTERLQLATSREITNAIAGQSRPTGLAA